MGMGQNPGTPVNILKLFEMNYITIIIGWEQTTGSHPPKKVPEVGLFYLRAKQWMLRRRCGKRRASDFRMAKDTKHAVKW